MSDKNNVEEGNDGETLEDWLEDMGVDFDSLDDDAKKTAVDTWNKMNGNSDEE